MSVFENICELVVRAESRIRPFIRETPLEHSFALSELAGCQVYLKLENLQFTGSFKARGALNKLMSLDQRALASGIITASTGNHGLAVAHGLSTLNANGVIYLPKNASHQKVNLLNKYGVDIKFHGDECSETEVFARGKSVELDQVYISPYNDPDIIGGQGTIALELEHQLESVDVLFVSVGGGGLISGIAGYLKESGARTKVIGCSPENSRYMVESVKAGSIVEVDELPTLSDGTAGGMEPDAITFEHCRRFVDDWLTVSEGEIRAAMKLVFESQRLVIEGSAGVTVASFLKHISKNELSPQTRVVLVICGGNIDIEKFKEIVCLNRI